MLITGRLLYSLIILWIVSMPVQAQDALIFQSLDELFEYADAHSIAFKNATEQNLLAKRQTLTAKFNQFNLKPSASFSLTDNLEQKVMFLPGGTINGGSGTLQEVTTGQQYVGNGTIGLQIDILNPLAIAKIKVSKINEKLTKINNLANRKILYESLAGTFYNVVALHKQIELTKQNIANIDNITQIIKHRVNNGIARPQDNNIAIINQIDAKNRLTQLEIQLEQQYDAIKILCDIGQSVPLKVLVSTDIWNNEYKPVLTASGNLQVLQKQASVDYHKADSKANRLWKLPTLSFVASNSWQQNSNDAFLDGSEWIDSNYIGLQLNFSLFDHNKKAAAQYSKINLHIAENDFEHALLQESINNRQLSLDYQKANGDYESSLHIEQLRQDSFEKDTELYREGVLSARELLDSNNNWLNSNLNVAALWVAKEYSETIININNNVQ